jgi:MoxR-like ATPase
MCFIDCALFIQVKRPVVLVGETGTSKTATVQDFLRQLNPALYVSGHQIWVLGDYQITVFNYN